MIHIAAEEAGREESGEGQLPAGRPRLPPGPAYPATRQAGAPADRERVDSRVLPRRPHYPAGRHDSGGRPGPPGAYSQAQSSRNGPAAAAAAASAAASAAVGSEGQAQ